MELNEFTQKLEIELKNNPKFAQYESAVEDKYGIKELRLKKHSNGFTAQLALSVALRVYEDADHNMETVIDTMLAAYDRQEKFTKNHVTLMAQLPYWNNVKDKIIPRLVNTEKMKDSLVAYPHIDLDIGISVTYSIIIDRYTAIVITKDKLKEWQISEALLHSTALVNLYMQDYSILSINEQMNDFLDKIEPNHKAELKLQNDDGTPSMYILGRTKDQPLGASEILNPAIMNEIRQKLGDFYILPSSIHEVIIVPKVPDYTPELLKSLIERSNRCVGTSEILSENVLAWDGSKLVTIL